MLIRRFSFFFCFFYAFIFCCDCGALYISITLFTVFSKIDFSFLAPLLCALGLVFLVWGLILGLAFSIGGFSRDWHIVWAVLGVILFTGYIIYDTYMIVTHLGIDDYVIAAVELYLDFINMFLVILALLTACGGQR